MSKIWTVLGIVIVLLGCGKGEGNQPPVKASDTPAAQDESLETSTTAELSKLCEGGTGEACFVLAKRLMKEAEGDPEMPGGGPNPKMTTAVGLIYQGCEKGSVMACVTVASASPDPKDAAVKFERAHKLGKEQCATGRARSCYEAANVLVLRPQLGSRDEASRLAKRACDKGYKMACSFDSDFPPNKTNPHRELIDRTRNTLHELANNCEKMKADTAKIIEAGMGVSATKARDYWTLWQFDQDPTGLPELPASLVKYKRQLADGLVKVVMPPVAKNPDIPEDCRKALVKAMSKMANNCGENGAPTSTRWITTAAAKECGLDPKTPSLSHCGSQAAADSARRRASWDRWGCRTKEEAGGDWVDCLPRSDYSPVKGAGCPGSETCCPPS